MHSVQPQSEFGDLETQKHSVSANGANDSEGLALDQAIWNFKDDV